jgi:FkbM family methyltransferase
MSPVSLPRTPPLSITPASLSEKRKRLARIIRRRRTLPVSAAKLLWLDYSSSVSQRVAPSRPFAIQLRLPGSAARCRVYLGGASTTIDRATFFDIFLDGVYDIDFTGVTVVDLGAHKGYFGAFALLRGAAGVWSYEPDPQNFALLRRGAASFTDAGCGWRVVNAAVGGETRTASLHISGESWAHSLLPLDGRRSEVGTHVVSVVPLREILAEASATGMRIVVKMDVEGAECEAVASCEPEHWRPVEAVIMEYHSFAPCPLAEITSQLQAAGLEPQNSGAGVDEIHLFRRESRDQGTRAHAR